MYQLSQRATRSIKTFLHGILISIIVYNLIARAFSSIPDDWLFFFTSDAVENLLCLAIAYSGYYLILRANQNTTRAWLLFASLSLLLILALLKAYRIHHSLPAQYSFDYFTGFLGQSVLYFLLVFTINRFDLLGKYQKMEKELTLAKEQLLRNQLHPHFLFNAFNSFYSLSLKNHPDMPNYILKLSGMMRYLTDEVHLEKVPLRKELEFIENYIALERLRFGQDARIQYNIEGLTNKDKWVEPFLLITLVENAFKHGFYTNMKEAFVTIDLQIGDGELQFNVENSRIEMKHFQGPERKGKGLENLKRRLELLYPKSSWMKVSLTPTTYTTNLKLILNDPA